MNTLPQVMVSSTFYDLKQVRSNLARFIEDELGCTPLVSELSSFPIDPTVDTVENCRRRVEQDADILILVIGGRYGSVDSISSKSVTNLEYLAARAKGIPIYVFVERRIHDLLPIWQMNQVADFSAAVDDTRVFTFIEEIRNKHKVWMREFDLAGDIISSLRQQLAYLTLQGAHFFRAARNEREYSILRDLKGAPLRIALEKPRGWEYKLFGEALIQEIQARRTLAEQKRLGITYGAYQWVTPDSVKPWAMSRVEELRGLIRALTVLVNDELRKALSQEDVELIVFTARSLAVLYQEAIEWSLRVRRTVGEEIVTSLAQAMDCFVNDILEKLDSMGPMVLREIDDLMEAESHGEPAVRSIKLNLNIPGAEAAMNAIAELASSFKAS